MGRGDVSGCSEKRGAAVWERVADGWCEMEEARRRKEGLKVTIHASLAAARKRRPSAMSGLARTRIEQLTFRAAWRPSPQT